MNLAKPKYPQHRFAKKGINPFELIVVCVFWGDKYPVEYVHKLRSMVARNMPTQRHRFVCLSDVDIPGVDCIPVFANSWRGWWQKVALFTPRLFPGGTRILYLDLDIVITRPIDDLVQMWGDDPLIMIKNFKSGYGHAAHNSSVMMWVAGDPRVAAIHDLFSADVMDKLHGDQCWIWRVLQDQITNWPLDLIQSYKCDCQNFVGVNTNIVVFHGDPKPHECQVEWVKHHWK